MVELVWDAAGAGTATASSGATVSVGDGAAFSPAELLATAAAGCLMRTFVAMAQQEEQPILGFVATSHLDTDRMGDPAPTLEMSVCVVGKDDAPPGVMKRLLDRALEASPVARALGPRVRVRLIVHRLCGAPAA